MNGLLLEVVSKREVAEHLEERVVIGGDPDVTDVPRSQTFLRGRRPRELNRSDPEELVLELVHSCRREQDGRIVLRHEHVRRPPNAALGLKERQILFTQFVSLHVRSRRVRGVFGTHRNQGCVQRKRCVPKTPRTLRMFAVVHLLRREKRRASLARSPPKTSREHITEALRPGDITATCEHGLGHGPDGLTDPRCGR